MNKTIKFIKNSDKVKILKSFPPKKDITVQRNTEKNDSRILIRNLRTRRQLRQHL